jgi:hypothetical protein
MQKTGSIERGDTSIRNSFFLLLLALFLTPLSLSGQDKDAGLWSGLALEKGINKWLEVKGAVEVRFGNNISQAEKYLAEIGLIGDIGKYFDVSLYYRYNYRYFTEYNWASYNRFYADIRFNYDYMGFTFYERTRVTFDEIPDFLEEVSLETTTRFKSQLTYNIRKTPLRTRGSVEFFLPVTKSFNPFPEKIRYKLGMVYKINQSVSAELGHMFQKVTVRGKPQNNYIWVVSFTYTL